MSIPAPIIYYYCKARKTRGGFLSLCLRSCCGLPRPFPPLFSPGTVASSGCMASPAIRAFSRHVWACLALFGSAILNCAIVVYPFIRPRADKALGRLFSAGFETSVFYTIVLEAYCLRTKLLVVFCPVLRSPEPNSVHTKRPCFLQRFYCNNYC
jgi:hypothetical protein